MILRFAVEQNMLLTTIRYVIVRGTISLLAIVSLVVAVRLLGPEETGKMTLVVGLISILAPMLALGTDTALARFVVNAPSVVANNLYRRAFFLVGLGTVCLVGLAVVAILLKILPPEVSDVAPWVVIISVVYSATLVNVYMLRGLGRLNISSVFEGIIEIGPRLLVVPLLILFLPTYVSYIHMQLLSLVFCFALSSWTIWHVRQRSVSEEGKIGPNQEHRKGYWLYASQMWLVSLLTLLFVNVSLWVVRYYLSPRDVGLFSIAQRLPNILALLFLSPLSAPLLYFYTANSELQERSRDIVQAIVLLSAIIGPLCLGLAGNSAWIVEHLFGAEFAGAAPVFMVYAHVLFLTVSHPFLLSLIFSQQRVHVVNLLTVIQIVALVVLSVWFVPQYGLIGAGVVVVMVYVLGDLLFAFWIRRTVPGLLSRVIGLFLLYLPFALLSVSSLWFVSVLGFPVALLLTRTLDLGFVKEAINRVRAQMSAMISNRRDELKQSGKVG